MRTLGWWFVACIAFVAVVVLATLIGMSHDEQIEHNAVVVVQGKAIGHLADATAWAAQCGGRVEVSRNDIVVSHCDR